MLHSVQDQTLSFNSKRKIFRNNFYIKYIIKRMNFNYLEATAPLEEVSIFLDQDTNEEVICYDNATTNNLKNSDLSSHL